MALHRQIDTLAKETFIVSTSLALVGITILLISETLRFWFCVVSAFLVLRHVCHAVAIEYLIPLKLRKTVSIHKKAVVITGCDTGFGNLLAKRLDKMGFHVFAGCLNPSENGGLELASASSTNLKVFQLDVADAKSVENAKQFVQDNIEDLDLLALVNNAGVYRDTLFEIMTMKNIEVELNINLLGVMRMTKEFLPLIRKCKGGRIVNVASAAGRYTVPSMATYCVSKHGVVVFSESLRMELRKLGVSVVTIEPFLYRTRLCDPDSVKRYGETSWNSAASELQSSYRELNALTRNKFHKLFAWIAIGNLDEVVDDLTAAVTVEVPKYSYCPGRLYQRLLMWASVALLPSPVRDIIYGKIVF